MAATKLIICKAKLIKQVEPESNGIELLILRSFRLHGGEFYAEHTQRYVFLWNTWNI